MFRAQQVLRTVGPLVSEDGGTVPAETRVVVLSVAGDEVRAKVSDPNFPEMAKVRVKALLSAFATTKRGRPRKQ